MKRNILLSTYMLISSCVPLKISHNCHDENTHISIRRFENLNSVTYLNRTALTDGSPPHYVYTFCDSINNRCFAIISVNYGEYNDTNFSINQNSGTDDSLVISYSKLNIHSVNDSISTRTSLCISLGKRYDPGIWCLMEDTTCYNVLTIEDKMKSNRANIVKAYKLSARGFERIPTEGLIRVGESLVYSHGSINNFME